MLESGNQIGPYVLIKKLGKGGFGEVWLAERRSKFVTKQVAVKIPFDAHINLEAIKQEATLWEQASGHPNVLPIIDADMYDEQVVIVSEYADGGSLADKLKLEGKLPVEKAVEITIGILNGLEFLHSRQIIHRDIKPQNILLQGSTPRLADFGISRLMSSTSISSVIVGTDAYMSPEAFDGIRNVQTDIWSVGVVLYELLTGNLPFPQEHPTERIFAVLTKEYEPISTDIPNQLSDIVQTALSKKPENRFQTADEMCHKLQKILSYLHHPTHAPTQVFNKPLAGADVNKTLADFETETNESKTGTKTEIIEEIKHNKVEIDQLPTIEQEISYDEIPPTVAHLTQVDTQIPSPETQLNINDISKTNNNNKSLYMYLGGGVATLFVILVVAIAGTAIYFSIGVGKGVTSKPSIVNSDRKNSVVIELSDGTLLINNEKISRDDIVGKLNKLMSDKSSSEKILYFEADDNAVYSDVIETLKFGDEADIKDFSLIAKGEKLSNSTKVNLASLNSAQNTSEIIKPIAYQDSSELIKPNPLQLIVAISNDEELSLNGEKVAFEKLESKLQDIFNARNNVGMFLQSRAPIGKTVFVRTMASVEYGYFLKVIKSIETSGADPINLEIN